MAEYKLEIITPQKIIFSDTVKSLSARSVNGNITILAKHAPILCQLVSSAINVELTNGKKVLYYTSGGFLNVKKEKTICLLEQVTTEKNIDLEKKKNAEILYKEKSQIASNTKI